MIGKKNHSYLPAQPKLLLAFLCFFAFLCLSFPSRVSAFDCISFYSCHFYNGPRARNCSKQLFVKQPFKRCVCYVSPEGRCEKDIQYTCDTQDRCNYYINYWRENGCPEYGDCCGCSAVIKPLPSPKPKPQPTPTPTPKGGVKRCQEACSSNSDCISGLSCGYNVSWGERRCHNPSCPLETDCSCNW